jgi:serine/threonine protein kinase/ribosomal protein S27E
LNSWRSMRSLSVLWGDSRCVLKAGKENVMRVTCNDCRIETTVLSIEDGSTHCAQCGKELTLLTDESSQTATFQVREDQLADDGDEVPESIGKYRVIRKVAQGGCGVVYLGRDDQLACNVAIKVPRVQNDQMASMMIQEARTLAQLRHANIVRVLAAEKTESGEVYIVMDWIAGKTLREWMAAGNRTVDECIGIISQVADAIHKAHKEGFVHRDLKPSNILLDEDGVPFVTDFGLALSEATQHQHRDEFAGTVAYMSPEQIRAESQYLDGRTDVWALGVMLYEMVGKRRPFVGAPAQVADEICNREPKPLRLLNEKIPPELEEIVKGCLTKTIDKRTSTAEQLATELRRIQTVTSSSPRSLSGNAKVLGVLVACFALTAYLFISNSKDPPEPSSAAPGVEQGTDPGNLSSERNLVVGKWNKLLDRSLQRLAWPGKETGSRLIEETELENLTAIANGVGLLRAGEISHQDCRIVITANQPDWNGGFGIFYGMVSTDTGYRYERIELSSVRERGADRHFWLNRYVVNCNKSFQLIGSDAIGGVPLGPPGQKKHDLVLVFTEGELTSVLWDGDKVHGLMTRTREDILPMAVVGGFGLFITDTTADFSQFRLFID